MTSRTQARGVSAFVELTKPAITGLSVFMAMGGYALAGGRFGFDALVAMAGTAMMVASANVLNMYVERESDRLMTRTAVRPLPEGRISAVSALIFGLVLGGGAVLVLSVFVNLITAVVGGLALASYVCVYTPMKRHFPMALVVGAVPGAAPPLMGWAAATGRLDSPAWMLFAILFLWQIPHFIAIGIYRSAEYERAGIRILSLVRGDRVARLHAIAYATALIPVSLSLWITGVASWLYAVVALGIGLWFWSLTLRGLVESTRHLWARRLFLSSLYYLPALMLGLALDRMLM